MVIYNPAKGDEKNEHSLQANWVVTPLSLNFSITTNIQWHNWHHISRRPIFGQILPNKYIECTLQNDRLLTCKKELF